MMRDYDYQESYGRHIPVDHRYVQRTRRAIRPPQLRLYNPSKIIAPIKNSVIQSFTFWNPFTTDNVLKAAYGSLAYSREAPRIDATKQSNARRRNSFRTLEDAFNIDLWPFGDTLQGESGNRHRNAHIPWGDHSSHERSLFHTLWEEFIPFRWSSMNPWYDDEGSYQGDNWSTDLQNYHRAAKADNSDSRPQACQRSVSKAPFSDIGFFWSSGSGWERSENGRYYRAKFRLPGVDEDNIKISVRKGILTVNAQSEGVQGTNENNCTVRHSQNFQHSLSIPRDAKESKAKAKFANGTLTVSIPITQRKSSWD